jgi:squalene-hopene/tetraprenyl-beta-curcumene cyclase
MEAQYVYFNRLLGRQRPELDAQMAERLLALQQADGGWPQYFGGPSHASISIEAYFALKLAGLRADEPAMQRARDFVLGAGGLAKAGVFSRIWLSFFGQYPAAGIPNIPVELIDAAVPANVY